MGKSLTPRRFTRAAFLATLVLAPILSAHRSVAGASQRAPLAGAGTEADPYVIGSFADFQAFADETNASTYWGAGIHVELTADIDLDPVLPGRAVYTAAVIAPDTDPSYGHQGTDYNGIFEGNGHTVSNYEIDTGAAEAGYLGLFGKTEWQAVIRNLRVEGAGISSTGKLQYVGLLCGENEADITNCSAAGTVEGGDDCLNVGAFCGYSSYADLVDCQSSGSVTLGSNCRTVAGFCANLDRGSVLRCSSATDLVVGDEAVYAAGFVAYAAATTIEQSFSKGNVTAGSSSTGVAGFCGKTTYGSDLLSDCYSTGTVETNDSTRSGGFIGYLEYGTLRRCYSVGTVTNPGRTAQGLCGSQFKGAVVSSFWDVDTSGTVLSAGGVGLATPAMQQAAPFRASGWDNGLWRIDEGNDYPRLVHEATPGHVIPPYVPDLSGAGTTGDPYRIASKTDLLELARGTFYWDKHYVLEADIDLVGETFTGPLIAYDDDNTFTGVLQGGGHTISNLTIEGNPYYAGLLGVIGAGGDVRNLAVTEAAISAGDATLSVGVLCGLNKGTVGRCAGTGTITAPGAGSVGGLCGENNGTATECFSTADVSAEDGERQGGFCGYNNGGTIENCYATGQVSGDGVTYQGGFCGRSANSPFFTNCYSVGPVTGTPDYYDHAPGGFISYDANPGATTACFWDIESSGLTSGGGTGRTTAAMKSRDTFSPNGWDNGLWRLDDGNDYPRLVWENTPGAVMNAHTPGLAGSGTDIDPYQIASVDDFLELTLGFFYWDKHYLMTADVDLAGHTFSRALFGANVNTPFSGVFDGDGHVVSNLFISGDNSYSALFAALGSSGVIRNLGLENATVICSGAVEHAGTLCAYNNRGLIESCYATGSVTAGGGASRIGGLCGRAEYATMRNCHVNVAVKAGDYAMNLAGFVGTGNRGTIEYCLSTGPVSGGNNATLGGFAGWCNSTVTGCFWDVDASGTIESAAGLGYGTTPLKRRATYLDAGWNFTDVWQMSVITGYPALIWEPNKGLTSPGPEAIIAGGFDVAWKYTDPGPEGVTACTLMLDEAELLTGADPAEGSLPVDSTIYADGWHEVRAIFTDAGGGVVSESIHRVLFLNAPGVTLHDEPIAGAESWDASTTHVVLKTLSIEVGAVLTVAPGAIVKFIDYSGMELDGTGRLVIEGALLTHFADDTAGGDTNLDGAASLPKSGLWEISGNGDITSDEFTEMRYNRTVLAGTIPEDLTLFSRRLYNVTGDLTVPSGVTLTVSPGAIVKFDRNTKLTVTGNLLAIGNRSQPIVLTSALDDEHGGDSNGDGDITYPQAGDWHQIYVGSGGLATLEYVRILYCSQANNEGALYPQGGTITFDNSVIAHTQYDAVRINGGTFTARNSLFTDSSLAIRPVSGTCEITNCLFYDITTGVRGGSGTFTNCVFARVAEVFQEWGPSTFTYCAFWNQEDFGPQTVDDAVLSTTSNLWADPLLRNPDNGDFSIHPGSPLIDAADGGAAPELDVLGQPRTDDPYTADTGQISASGACPDIGIYEFAESAISEVDISVDAVSGPPDAIVGQEANVSWEVRNEGTARAIGPWRDEVALEAADGSAPGALRAIAKAHVVNLELDPGESAEVTARIFIPPVVDGLWHVAVQANAWRDLFEGSLTTNNRSVSEEAFWVENPVLSMGGAVTGNLDPGGRGDSFRLNQMVDDGPVVVRITGVECQVYAGFGRMPSPTSNDGQGSHDGILRLPAAHGARDVYLLVVNGGSSPVPFELSADMEGFTLISVGVASGGDEDGLRLPLSGTGFEEGMTVTLRTAAGRADLPAESVIVYSATEAEAVFNLAGQAAGDYDVTASLGGDTAELPAAFNLIVGARGELEALLDMPDSVRQGRYYTGWIEYANIGNAPMNAPVLIVSSPQVEKKRLSEHDDWKNHELKVLGISETHPVGVLKPGERRRIPFYYMTPPDATTASFRLQSYVPNDRPVDWDDFIPVTRPASALRSMPRQPVVVIGSRGTATREVPEERWNEMWESALSRTGETWADFLAALSENASYLARHGQTTYAMSELLDFELRQTTGFGIPGIFYGKVDAQVTGREGTITFARWTPPMIEQRFRLTGFGFGWTHTYDYEMRRRSGTIRLYTPGGGIRCFFKSGAAWTGMPWDPGEFYKEDGDYVLQEKSGQRLRFDTYGRLLDITDAYGKVISMTRNGHGELTRVALADGRGIDITYSEGAEYEPGLISSVTDPDGRVTTYAYNEDMQLTAVTDDEGRVTYFTRIPPDGSLRDNLLTEIAYPDGSHQYYEYDDAGRLTRQWRDGGKEEFRYTYGEGGEVRVLDLLGNQETYFYGLCNNILAYTDALGRRATFAFGEDGRLIRVTDPASNTTELTRNPQGQITRNLNPAGQVVSMDYEERFGALSRLTDARDNRVVYEHNGAGDVDAIVSPDDTANRYEYDADGNITSSWNRRGERINYEYDTRGNMSRKAWVDGGGAETRVFTYTYGPRGNLTRASDSLTGDIDMSYDAGDRMTRITYPNGKWLDFGYDELGRRTSRTDQDGLGQSYIYDNFGRLGQVNDQAGALIAHYSYDDLGRLIREDRGNGCHSTVERDAAGRIVEINHYQTDGATLQAWCHYTYDVAGNIASMTTREGTTHYSHDALGQLVQVNYPDGGITRYTYDAAGNRLTVEDDGAPTVCVPNGLNQYTHIGGDLLHYDSDGNLIRIERPAGSDDLFSYDAENRLTGITLQDGTVKQFSYDALGNRYRQQVDGAETFVVHDPKGLDNPVAEYDNDGTLLQRHLHGQGLIASVDGTGTTRHLNYDIVGNTRLVQDSAGAVLEEIDYTPFGKVRSGGTSTDFLFSGQYGIRRDAPNLYHMRNRTYAASAGRFMQSDPIGIFGGVNFYAYCRNSPLDTVDPSGLDDNEHNFVERFRNLLGRRDSQGDGAWNMDENNYERHRRRERRNVDDYFEAADELGDDLAEIQPTSRPKSLKDLKKIFLFFWDFMSDYFECLDQDRDRDDDDDGDDDDDDDYDDEDNDDDDDDDNDDGDRDDEDDDNTDVPQSCDPNAMEGPLGFGDPDTERYVLPGQWMNYIIYFENKPSAGAAAQEVWVRNPLPEEVDWTTLELGEVVFNNQTESGLVGAKSGTVEVDQGGTPYRVKIQFLLEENTDTGKMEAKWYLRSLDPSTLDGWPSDPYAGFLPPNDADPDDEGLPGDHPGDPYCGEGHVCYRVRLKAKEDLTGGTVVENDAEIIFDYNDPIWTWEEVGDKQPPGWFNTVAGDLPEAPANPFPGDTATGIAARTRHSWASALLATEYDVYVWQVPPLRNTAPEDASDRSIRLTRPPELTPVATTSTRFYAPIDGLPYNTHCAWQVVARNIYGETDGPIWTFTTGLAPVSGPGIEDGAAAQSDLPTLSWDAHPDAEAYDLYLWQSGEAEPASPTAGGITGTSWAAQNPLLPWTTYLWRVVGKNPTNQGRNEGVWIFTTGGGRLTLHANTQWNMMSLPFDLPAGYADIDDALDDERRAGPIAEGAWVWNTRRNCYIATDRPDGCSGFWTYRTAPGPAASAEIDGRAEDEPIPLLGPGWNMVGLTRDTALQDLDVPFELEVKMVLRWDPDTQSFTQVDPGEMMSRGRAYWIHLADR